MKILIILLFPICSYGQFDSTNVVTNSGEVSIRDVLKELLLRINLNSNLIATKQNALGYTPYNATNPNGYISSITGPMVIAALGYTPVNSSNPIGYGAGSGGTVTQTGTKTNAVTLNKLSGQITTTNTALAAGAEVSFTLNNSTIAATDVVFVSIASGGTAGAYFVNVGSIGAGVCTITLGNVSTGSLSQAITLNFIVLKGSSN